MVKPTLCRELVRANRRAPSLNTPDQSNAPQPPLQAPGATAGASAPPDLLGPVVLHTMPPQVAAFMLYEPREPPP